MKLSNPPPLPYSKAAPTALSPLSPRRKWRSSALPRLLLSVFLGLLTMQALLGNSRVEAGEAHKHTRKPPPPAHIIAGLPGDGGPDYNRLVFEKSPYLLQHCSNPVNWYPWGPEAFAMAKKLDRPIFLSVGYSTCHWCHVMERESFEVDEVAKVLNETVIAIKVDREERPDLDEIYMLATQIITQRGGWPNSVWLTPDAKPFYAGTYFPRKNFIRITRSIGEVWKNERSKVSLQADRLAEAIRSSTQGPPGKSPPLDSALLDTILQAQKQRFDHRFGGYGSSPKFPPHHTFRLYDALLRNQANPDLLKQITVTLDKMILGGIHDHVGGGFHRYSTDGHWFLPHFEKMLYDNAFMGSALANAYRLTGEERYRETARGLFDWVLRDMQDPKTGAFYSALDADSEGEEGKFYLWTPTQVSEILGATEAPLFLQSYSVTASGNYYEEASGEKKNTSIPHRDHTFEQIAASNKVPRDLVAAQLTANLKALRQSRDKRIWPHLDDKVLTDWNGLMIHGLAVGGKILEEPRYLEAASQAADFFLKRMRKGTRLLHTYRDEEARLLGYLNDYAYLSLGLLDLYDATGEEKWLAGAETLTDRMLTDFWDPKGGGFFFTSEAHEDLLARSKDPMDRALPSGNGIGAQVLVRLAALTKKKIYRERAQAVLETSAASVARAPAAMQSLGLALSEWLALTGTKAKLKPGTAEVQEYPVTLRATVSPSPWVRTEARPLKVEVTLRPGWHLQAADPGQPDLIATQLRAGADASVTLGPVKYPEPAEKNLPFFEKPLRVLEGSFLLQTKMRPKPSASTGDLAIPLALEFQPCDETRCLPPRVLELSLPVNFR